jgi:hypothetical protein
VKAIVDRTSTLIQALEDGREYLAARHSEVRVELLAPTIIRRRVARHQPDIASPGGFTIGFWPLSGSGIAPYAPDLCCVCEVRAIRPDRGD